MATNQVEIRSEVSVQSVQTEGKKSKAILYPGQTLLKMKYTDGMRIGISLSSM